MLQTLLTGMRVKVNARAYGWSNDMLLENKHGCSGTITKVNYLERSCQIKFDGNKGPSRGWFKQEHLDIETHQFSIGMLNDGDVVFMKDGRKGFYVKALGDAIDIQKKECIGLKAHTKEVDRVTRSTGMVYNSQAEQIRNKIKSLESEIEDLRKQLA